MSNQFMLFECGDPGVFILTPSEKPAVDERADEQKASDLMMSAGSRHCQISIKVVDDLVRDRIGNKTQDFHRK